MRCAWSRVRGRTGMRMVRGGAPVHPLRAVTVQLQMPGMRWNCLQVGLKAMVGIWTNSKDLEVSW